jgi:hypothetical protein
MASAVARRHKMVSATRGRGDIAIEAEVTRDGTAAPRPEMVGSVRIGSSCWLVIFREIRVSQSSRNTPPSRTNKEKCMSAGERTNRTKP